MADVIGLSDVSSKDTGKGIQLKTGNLKRSYNMPKACVKKKIAGGMSPKAAHAACYPKEGKKGFPTHKSKAKQESAMRKVGSLSKPSSVSKTIKKRKSELSPKLKKY